MVINFTKYEFQKCTPLGEDGHTSGDVHLRFGGDVIFHCDDTRGTAFVIGYWRGEIFKGIN